MFSVSAFAQFTSLDINMDARAIAMGESFVANPNGLVAADNNPATLIGQKGLSIFYNRRNSVYTKGFDDIFYYSAGASLETSIGNFSLLYKRFKDILYLVGDGLYINGRYHNSTLNISYANTICENLSYGINIKTFSYKTELNDINLKEGESNNPLLFDFGLLYSPEGLINHPSINDEINFGASLVNFGTDFKVKRYTDANRQQNSVVVNLPRLAKVGLTYNLNIVAFAQPEFLQFTFTGEYNLLLNNFRFYNQMDYEEMNSSGDGFKMNFWKLGIETTIMNVLSLRIGGISYSSSNYAVKEGNLNLRYGLGVDLPLILIGINYPVNLIFDYALIQTEDKDNSLNAFNFSLRYNNPLF